VCREWRNIRQYWWLHEIRAVYKRWRVATEKHDKHINTDRRNLGEDTKVFLWYTNVIEISLYDFNSSSLKDGDSLWMLRLSILMLLVFELTRLQTVRRTTRFWVWKCDGMEIWRGDCDGNAWEIDVIMKRQKAWELDHWNRSFWNAGHTTLDSQTYKLWKCHNC
jgi:hypothetical protein